MDDLGPNKARLKAVASRAEPGDVMVDLGVRTGVSSRTMLEACAHAHVIGVDPCPRQVLGHERYTYLQMDSISAANSIYDKLYLVFFDTLHIREQVMAELHHYWPKIRVGGWAVFHDTEWPHWKHDTYLGKTWAQAADGVADFFRNAGQHIYMEHHEESWGMTFVQKRDASVWNIEGIEEALICSEQLTQSLCGV